MNITNHNFKKTANIFFNHKTLLTEYHLMILQVKNYNNNEKKSIIFLSLHLVISKKTCFCHLRCQLRIVKPT